MQRPLRVIVLANCNVGIKVQASVIVGSEAERRIHLSVPRGTIDDEAMGGRVDGDRYSHRGARPKDEDCHRV